MANDSNRGGLKGLLTKRDQPNRKADNWVRVGIVMHPDDLEVYRNFYWFIKNQSGNSAAGHKEIMHELLELAKDKYGEIPERSDKEKESEQKYMKPKQKK